MLIIYVIIYVIMKECRKELYCFDEVINRKTYNAFFTRAQEWRSWHLKNT